MRIFKPRSLRSAFGFSFAFTLLSKGVGFSRQWLLAYTFGVSRQVDLYMMAFGIAMLSIFPFTLWFDQIVLPRLVIAHEQEGSRGFQKLCACAFSFSLVMALGFAVLFVLWVPAASWLLSHGFSPEERLGVRRFAFFFIPWVLIIFPYNALSAILKSMRYYDAVMATDFLVSITATAGFALFHHDLISLPLSLAAGYGVAALALIYQAKKSTPLLDSPWAPDMVPIFKDFGRMLMVYPFGFIQLSGDRLFQSYLMPGAIAGCGYAGQMVGPAFELLAFDEAFIVPLSSTEGRAQKIHRLLAGLTLLTVPIVIFLIWKAPVIVSILFEYGHFGVRALDLTSAILRILVITLFTSTVCTPLMRLLQISGRILQTSYLSCVSAVVVLSLNFLFVIKLHWSVVGTTAAAVIGTVVYLMTAIVLVKKAGYPIMLLRLLRYFIWALAASALAILGAHALAHLMVGGILLLMAQGLIFVSIATLLYWPVRGQIQFILYG